MTSIVGGHPEEHSMQGKGGCEDSSSPSMRVSRDFESSFSSWYTEWDTFEIDFTYECKCLLQKGNIYSVFRASPVSAVS